MSVEEQVGKLHMELSDLELKLERTEKEGYEMAELLKVVAEALERPEVRIYDPIKFANDEVFSIVGYDNGRGNSMIVGRESFPVSSYPNVKDVIKSIYDLKAEIKKVETELKKAEGKARNLR